LFDWKVPGDPGRADWWHGRHDERNTGQYGLDTRRPAVVTGASAKRAGLGLTNLDFTTTGDDWNVGTADHYEITWTGGHFTVEHPPAAGAPMSVPLTVPKAVTNLTVSAIDDAGNRSAPVIVPIK